MGSSLVTTPIFYANASPHIGHLYSALLADVAHRWQRLCHPDHQHFLLSGTDEHGAKIAAAAAAAGQEPLVFCDHVSAQYQHLLSAFDVQPTAFVRTTHASHTAAVKKFWLDLEASGCLASGSYAGWYCQADEAFCAPRDVEDREQSDGSMAKVSKESGRVVEWVEEKNVVFRLQQFKPELRAWLESGVVEPEGQVGNLLHWLEGYSDPSVSRDSRRASWGLPVPGDPSQTIYVWVDALVSYLSGVGWPQDLLHWPPSVHILGKDIAVFHAILWPALLLALRLPLPRHLYVHSHWQVGKEKMSKSLGNVVDPFQESAVLGSEPLRYFLIRHPVPKRDATYSRLIALQLLNDELANVHGNLLNRCTAKRVNPNQVWAAWDVAEYEGLLQAQPGAGDLLALVRQAAGDATRQLECLDLCHALETLLRLGRAANGFYQVHQPWKLVQDRPEAAAAVISACLEALHVIGLLLQPVVPHYAHRLLSALNVPPHQRVRPHLAQPLLCASPTPLSALSQPLFTRLKNP